jgi:oligosaccharyltransferase complex subunit gamma
MLTSDFVMSLCFVVISFFVPTLSSAAEQRIAAYSAIGLFFVTYSVLMFIFKMKNGGYPFKLVITINFSCSR